MSVPARRIARPAPRRPARRADVVAPARVTRSPRRRPATSPLVPRPRRPLLVAGTTVFVLLLLAFVSLSVLLAQDALRAADLEVRVDRLIAERNDLLREQAALSSPERIAEWASRNGFVMPSEVSFGAVAAATAPNPTPETP